MTELIEEITGDFLSLQLNHSSSTKIFTSRKSNLKTKLDAIKASGTQNLKIVSDFDYTMTKFWIDGTKKASSCHKILEDCGLLTQEYHDGTEKLEKKYFPIENDPTISVSDKTKHMEEWATNSRALLFKSGLTKSVIPRAVNKALTERAAELREGVDNFFKLTDDQAIPLLIFSAGISDILEEILLRTKTHCQENAKSTYIVSNRCIFQETSYEDAPLAAFSLPVIHVFNKKSENFLDTAFFKETDESSRDNVVLIGDSMGDLFMVQGMSHNANTLLTIGFLNVNANERLKQYTDAYDIVITGNESSFEIPLKLIQSIASSTSLAIDFSTTAAAATVVDNDTVQEIPYSYETLLVV